MAKNDVSIKIKAETELEQARFDAQRAFSRMEGDARDAAEGVERPFAKAADGISQEFEGIDDDLRQSFSRAEAAAAGAAGEIESEFGAAADDIPGQFSRVRDRLSGVWGDVESDAGGAADGIAEQFSGLAEGIDVSNIGGTLAGGFQSVLAAGGPVFAVVGAAAALFGDELASGISDGFSRRSQAVSVSIRTGLGDIDLADTGRIAGEAYSKGFGEGLSELRFEVAAVRRELEGFDLGAEELQLNKELQLLQDQFGIELPQSIEISRRAVANNLAPSVSSALDGIYSFATELPLTFEEGLDVLSEYAPTFGGINLSMAQFTTYLAEVERSGRFENLSQGAEAIREFNTRLGETGRLTPFFAELSLSADQIQAAFARGDAPAAIAAINTALQEFGDQTRADVIAAELFGTAVEDSSDRLATVDAIAQALNATLEDQTGVLDRATEAQERNRTGWERLSADIEAGAGKIGELLNVSAEGWYALIDAAQDGDVVGDIALGIADRLGLLGDETDYLAAKFGISREAAEELGDSLTTTGDISSRAVGPVQDLADETEDFSVAADDAAVSVDDLVDSLGSLLNFSADQVMRDIADAGDRLAETIAGADVSLIGLNGTIDTSTDEGRQLQEQFERLSEQQIRASDAFADGSITAAEYTAAQAAVKAQLDRVTSAAPLTAAQVQGLADKYGLLPGDVETILRAKDEASALAINLQRQYAAIPRVIETVQKLYVQNFKGSSTASAGRSSGANQRARGGYTQGLTLVGEEGPEIAERNGQFEVVGVGGPELRYFADRTMIHNADDSAGIVGGGPTSKPVGATTGGGSGTGVYIDKWIVQDGRDSWQDLRYLESMYRAAAV